MILYAESALVFLCERFAALLRRAAVALKSVAVASEPLAFALARGAFHGSIIQQALAIVNMQA